MKISPKAIILFKLTLTVLLIIFLLKRIKMNEVLGIIKQVKLGYLFLSAALYLFFMTVAAYRWHCLMGIQKIKLGFGKTFRLTFIGYFFNNFLPTTVGGDVIKGYLVAQETKKTAESYVSVLMDRVIGLVGLVIVAVVVILFIPHMDINQTVIYLIWGAFFTFAILIFLSSAGSKFLGKRLTFLSRIVNKLKIENKVKKVYDIFHAHKEYKGVLVKTVFLSLVIQITFVFVNVLVVKGLPLTQKIPIGYFFVYTPTIALISSLPVTMNGIGLRENLYVEFFSRVLGKEVAGSLSILLLIFLWAAGLLGGIFYLFSNLRAAPIKIMMEKEALK